MPTEDEKPEAPDAPPAEEAPAPEAEADDAAPADAEAVAMTGLAMLDAIIEKGLPAGLTSITIEGFDGDAMKIVAKGDGEPVEVSVDGDELARRVGAMADGEAGE
jgi:hypothetical protein